ncbi:GldG family protein [Parerythrobacter lacustris]|uniref:GldG family protein n=1 Tax=Parerythrobacter lacustris TaxID=2969984 RepID=A0ABT1XTF2_9SPHN|nr:GldG family protein [Parerythrobacter lacustris]MCR2834906.1 GldG family protein [Parerythrobacter lacustris]
MLRSKLALGMLAMLCAGSAAAWLLARGAEDKPSLGLVTSLPVYWPEEGSIEDMLSGDSPPHWVRTELEVGYRLVPLDVLSDEMGNGTPSPALEKLDLLLLAQPHALPPADLVALDSWLREGGRALILSDPMLTEHSHFALGDRRRPQDIAMLDPLLARWGLSLQFDPDQQTGVRTVMLAAPVEARIVVELPGKLIDAKNPEKAANCAIGNDGLVALCQIGKGQALILADAALLQVERAEESGHSEGLEALLDSAFAQ